MTDIVKVLKYDINSNSAFTLLVNDVEAFTLLMVALHIVLIVTLWSKLETV